MKFSWRVFLNVDDRFQLRFFRFVSSSLFTRFAHSFSPPQSGGVNRRRVESQWELKIFGLERLWSVERGTREKCVCFKMFNKNNIGCCSSRFWNIFWLNAMSSRWYSRVERFFKWLSTLVGSSLMQLIFESIWCTERERDVRQDGMCVLEMFAEVEVTWDHYQDLTYLIVLTRCLDVSCNSDPCSHC